MARTMPVYRKRSASTSYSSSPSPFKKPLYSKAPAAALKRVVAAAKETGFVDLASASYATDTTGTITLIATVPQGASVNQRVGKKILWKSIQIRGLGTAGSTTVASDVAYLIVYDRRPTGSLPAITDVLDSVSSRSMNNDANSGRFKILRRKDWVFVGNTTTFTEATAVSLEDYIKLPMLPAVFKAAGTGAINDIEEGALYLITVGNQAAGTSAGSITIGIRTRFYDA